MSMGFLKIKVDLKFKSFFLILIEEDFPSYLDTLYNDTPRIELAFDFDLEAFLAPSVTTATTLQKSEEVTEQSEANENNGMDTSMFSGYDEVNLLSPSIKIASSNVDENGELIDFNPQAFDKTQDHFGEA